MFWLFGVDGVTKVIDLWVDWLVALGVCFDIVYVLVFENWGVEVGVIIFYLYG